MTAGSGVGGVEADNLDAISDPCRQLEVSMAKQDDFLKHEVVHSTYLISDLFDRAIVDHKFVAANPHLLKRAQNIAGLLGDLYQAAAGYAAGREPDAERPKFERTIAERGPSATRVLDAIKRRGGMTELEIAQKLYGATAVQQRVNGDCRFLLKKGLVERRGAGGRSDPFVYYVIAK
jgi:hypothetical protein